LREHLWAAEETLNIPNRVKENFTGKLPVLVQTISTDGLQVKVQTITFGQFTRPRTFRALGVDELVHREFHSIKDNMDLKVDKYGLFNTISVDPSLIGIARITGVDPGQRELVTACIETTSDNSFELPKHSRTTKLSISAADYRKRTYMDEELAMEAAARDFNGGNNNYKAALAAFNTVSLRYPGKIEDYINVFFTHFDAMRTELITVRRRFARFKRFSATKRFFDYVARRIFYEAEDKKLRKMKLKGKKLRKMKKRLYYTNRYLRFVSYGIPTFGHGRYGPCPTKKIIRACARRGPVLLVDEHYTSQRCHSCGCETRKYKKSRLLVCGNSLVDGAIPCRLSTDRDVNAGMNQGRIGSDALKTGQRPSHLPLPNRTPQVNNQPPLPPPASAANNLPQLPPPPPPIN